jgi:tetratricopeptide (TPR) repeat protein
MAESEKAYRTALQLDNNVPDAYAELYRVLLTEGKLEEAAEDLKQAISHVPSYPGFALMLAAQALTTTPASAPPFIEQLKSRNLGLPAANLITGDFYVRDGHLERARQEYRNCFSNNKYALTCRARLIRMSLLENNRNGLNELAEETLQLDHGNTAALTAAAVMKGYAGDAQAAERGLRSLLDVVTDGPLARYYWAKIQVKQGQFDEALLNLDVASQRQPDFVRARLLLANVQFALRHYADARKSAEAVLAIQSDNAQAHKILDSAKSAGNDQVGPAKLSTRPGFATSDVLANSESTAVLAQEIPLKDSVCDAAVAAFKKLRSQDYARIDLAAAVPGVWSTSDFSPFIGN